MKKNKIIFWIATGLFCIFMLTSAIPEIISTSDWKNIMSSLGYPEYLNPFLGVLKLLGIIALLVPGFPRVKEWAYAGFFFDLFGATYSALTKFGWAPEMAIMIIPFTLLATSYIYHHKILGRATLSTRI
ncbi:MAG: DoxX-like family protein [Bacteroidetes bacterium]|nr:MAG: DoxX-like family protein [Bacteroidota bacterium]